MFQCKQLRFVSLRWKFLNNSSAYYNFKDVSGQLQVTFKKKCCTASYRISSTLWQMVLAFWPQFSLCFANQLPAAWEYTFSWAKYSKVDTSLGLWAFSRNPALGHVSIENARFLLLMANVKALEAGKSPLWHIMPEASCPFETVPPWPWSACLPLFRRAPCGLLSTSRMVSYFQLWDESWIIQRGWRC